MPNRKFNSAFTDPNPELHEDLKASLELTHQQQIACKSLFESIDTNLGGRGFKKNCPL